MGSDGVTLVLYGNWANTMALPIHHDLLTTHKILYDVYVSSMDPGVSLRDVISSGNIVHAARSSGFDVQIHMLDNAQHADMFRHMSITKTFETLLQVETHLESQDAKRQTLNLIVLPKHPVDPRDTIHRANTDTKPSSMQMCISQNVHITNALDTCDRIKRASRFDTYFLAYGSIRPRGAVWTQCDKTVFIYPERSPITRSELPLSASSVPACILKSMKCDMHDLVTYTPHAVTVDKRQLHETLCTIRLKLDGRVFRVHKVWPPDNIVPFDAWFSDSRSHDGLSILDEGDEELMLKDFTSYTLFARIMQECRQTIITSTREGERPMPCTTTTNGHTAIAEDMVNLVLCDAITDTCADVTPTNADAPHDTSPDASSDIRTSDSHDAYRTNIHTKETQADTPEDPPVAERGCENERKCDGTPPSQIQGDGHAKHDTNERKVEWTDGAPHKNEATAAQTNFFTMENVTNLGLDAESCAHANTLVTDIIRDHGEHVSCTVVMCNERTYVFVGAIPPLLFLQMREGTHIPQWNGDSVRKYTSAAQVVQVGSVKFDVSRCVQRGNIVLYSGRSVSIHKRSFRERISTNSIRTVRHAANTARTARQTHGSVVRHHRTIELSRSNR